MEDVEPTNASNEVVGATGIGPADEEAMNPLDDSDLPLVVWLKGDESFVDDFSMDADATMKALGIKRSRLTQISGRELRVGRIRIDRYTRPVYRPEDIEIYKQWTRPTATHLRSSSVITDAAKKLEQHSEQISEDLKQGLAEQVGALNESISAVRDESKQHLIDYVAQTTQIAEDLKQHLVGQSERCNEELRERLDGLVLEQSRSTSQLKQLDELSAQLHNVQSGSVSQHQQTEVIIKALAQLTEYLAGFVEQQTGNNRDMGKALSLMIQFVRESSQKQEEILRSIRGASQTEQQPHPEIKRSGPALQKSATRLKAQRSRRTTTKRIR